MALRIWSTRSARVVISLVSVVFLFASVLVVAPRASRATPAATPAALGPVVSQAAAFDVSAPFRDLARLPSTMEAEGDEPDERGAIPADNGYTGDGALQTTYAPHAATSQRAAAAAPSSATIPSPSLTFEGMSNDDNIPVLGFQISPPDPVGDVGPNHYVEMVNVNVSVYAKTGTRLLGPVSIGSLWNGFPVTDCTNNAGDPVVVYDQLEDRWILTEFTADGPEFWDCVAVSQTGDPTGAYFRYAFSAGANFPDYPKYGVWTNAYFLSTREFAPDDSFAGDGLYALEKNKMINGEPDARMIKFLLEPGVKPYLPGDGLLPPDIDGTRRPIDGSPGLFVGTMDDGAGRGAPFDGLNVFKFSVAWSAHPTASFTLAAQLPVAQFDSLFPCSPGSRQCIPQPGTSNKIDILSYRQRPTWRLAYRNFGTYEAFVTNQSVEALPGVAGVRWYEIRRVGSQISLYQQGTYAPNDGVHRWMGSVAMDKRGDMALGYSVSNATSVFPGIRYTGRLGGDPLGQMTLGEAVLINGSGSQLVSNRWGDYTSMNVDPSDDCTFWYVNEYYQTSSARGWQTRIGAFRLPGCA
jgi:hypothetical protein